MIHDMHKWAMYAAIASLVGLILFSKSAISIAADLGVHGPVFEIVEEDVVAALKRRASELAANGTFDQINKRMEKSARDRLFNLPPIEGLVEASADRHFYFDPTVQLSDDIVDADGRRIYTKGMSINPLETMPYNKRLFFIDPRKQKQVDWVRQMAAETDKIVLVAGNLVETSKALNRVLYYDQGGTLIRRFGIQATPAMVHQERLQLLITEKAL